LQGAFKCRFGRPRRIGPCFDQFGAPHDRQARPLRDSDRFAVVRGHEPLALLGNGQTHRLTVGTDHGRVVGKAVSFLLIRRVADRQYALGVTIVTYMLNAIYSFPSA
jgi:hypothetical protein